MDGMILRVLEKYDIDMKKLFLAGERLGDEGIAEYFNLIFFGVNYTPKNFWDVYVSNLLEMIPYVEKSTI